MENCGADQEVEQEVDQEVEEGVEEGVKEGVEQGVDQEVEQGVDQGVEQNFGDKPLLVLQEELELGNTLLKQGSDLGITYCVLNINITLISHKMS